MMKDDKKLDAAISLVIKNMFLSIKDKKKIPENKPFIENLAKDNNGNLPVCEREWVNYTKEFFSLPKSEIMLKKHFDEMDKKLKRISKYDPELAKFVKSIIVYLRDNVNVRDSFSQKVMSAFEEATGQDTAMQMLHKLSDELKNLTSLSGKFKSVFSGIDKLQKDINGILCSHESNKDKCSKCSELLIKIQEGRIKHIGVSSTLRNKNVLRAVANFNRKLLS